MKLISLQPIITLFFIAAPFACGTLQLLPAEHTASVASPRIGDANFGASVDSRGNVLVVTSGMFVHIFERDQQGTPTLLRSVRMLDGVASDGMIWHCEEPARVVIASAMDTVFYSARCARETSYNPNMESAAHARICRSDSPERTDTALSAAVKYAGLDASTPSRYAEQSLIPVALWVDSQWTVADQVWTHIDGRIYKNSRPYKFNFYFNSGPTGSISPNYLFSPGFLQMQTYPDPEYKLVATGGAYALRGAFAYEGSAIFEAYGQTSHVENFLVIDVVKCVDLCSYINPRSAGFMITNMCDPDETDFCVDGAPPHPLNGTITAARRLEFLNSTVIMALAHIDEVRFGVPLPTRHHFIAAIDTLNESGATSQLRPHWHTKWAFDGAPTTFALIHHTEIAVLTDTGLLYRFTVNIDSGALQLVASVQTPALNSDALSVSRHGTNTLLYVGDKANAAVYVVADSSVPPQDEFEVTLEVCPTPAPSMAPSAAPTATPALVTTGTIAALTSMSTPTTTAASLAPTPPSTTMEPAVLTTRLATASAQSSEAPSVSATAGENVDVIDSVDNFLESCANQSVALTDGSLQTITFELSAAKADALAAGNFSSRDSLWKHVTLSKAQAQALLTGSISMAVFSTDFVDYVRMYVTRAKLSGEAQCAAPPNADLEFSVAFNKVTFVSLSVHGASIAFQWRYGEQVAALLDLMRPTKKRQLNLASLAASFRERPHVLRVEVCAPSCSAVCQTPTPKSIASYEAVKLDYGCLASHQECAIVGGKGQCEELNKPQPVTYHRDMTATIVYYGPDWVAPLLIGVGVAILLIGALSVVVAVCVVRSRSRRDAAAMLGRESISGGATMTPMQRRSSNTRRSARLSRYPVSNTPVSRGSRHSTHGRSRKSSRNADGSVGASSFALPSTMQSYGGATSTTMNTIGSLDSTATVYL